MLRKIAFNEITIIIISQNAPYFKLYLTIQSDIVIYNDDNYQSLELNLDRIMRDIDMFSKNDKIFVN